MASTSSIRYCGHCWIYSVRGISSGSLTLITTVIRTAYNDSNITNGWEYNYAVSAMSLAAESVLTDEAVATLEAHASDGGSDMTIILIIIGVVAIAGILGAIWYMRMRKLTNHFPFNFLISTNDFFSLHGVTSVYS